MAVKTDMKMEVRQTSYTTYYSEEQTDKIKFGPTNSRSAS